MNIMEAALSSSHHALVHRMQECINPYTTMSRQAYSELIDYFNYNSPPMAMVQTFGFPAVPQFLPVQQQQPRYPPIPQYPMQPWPYYYNPPATAQDSFFHYQSQYGNWNNPSFIPSPPPAFLSPVEFVDGVAILLPGEDVNPSFIPSPPSPVDFVDGVAILVPVEDVDYEDWLQLEEHMGRVKVGLSEETISKHMKTHVACKNIMGETCVVCQDEYQRDETVSTLHCGHCYHADCIKEWLLHKNVCPVCKATALNV